MNKFTKGFTLVELMVVITIIALLSGIVVTNLTGSRAKSRDAKRISDMGQIQLALELYFDRCRVYPNVVSTTNSVDISSSCTKNGEAVPLTNYISKIPQPSGEAGQADYYYIINTDKSDYVLKAKLENYNEVLKDGMVSNNWSTPVECKNDQTDREYCLSPK